MSEDLQSCESCDKSVPIQDAVYSEGCYFCPECFAEWEAEFRACAHEWSQHTTEHGEPSLYCHKCAGVVPMPSDSDFAGWETVSEPAW